MGDGHHSQSRHPVVSRELSMLAFNARVLHEAQDQRTLLLDRFRFLSIVSSNVDEFFSVRVSGIREQIDAGLRVPGADGRTPLEQMHAIRESAALLAVAKQETWRGLVSELSAAGVPLVQWADLEEVVRDRLSARFTQEIFPVLTPLAVDPGHPFPYVSSLSLSLAVRLNDPERGANFFARVKVPQILGRIVEVGDGRVLLIEELIKAHLHELFAGHEIIDAYLFRITRDADFEVEEGEADDLLAAIEEELRQRRFGKVIRLEVEAGMSEEVRALLLAGLSLNADALAEVDGVLDLTVGAEIASLPHPELRAPTWQPVTPARITAASHAADGAPDLFEVIREGDLLMHYPYESFDASAERLFQQAASDPDVLSIRATLYRTGATSSIPGHLIQAARAGKEVVVLVELKARFDEAANIEWARRLEEAGAHVIYGMSGLKTHCKATLIARREEAVPLTLQDTYLDHAGLLNARGWSLRRREINGGETGYTLKRGARTVGALHNREEVEALARNASGAGSATALPAEISDLIVDEFGAEITTQLQPTVTLTQQRRTWPLMHTGVTVAICSIDQVQSASDAWSELEIEFLTSLGEEKVAQLAKEIDDALRNEPGVSPSTESKAERARRLAL